MPDILRLDARNPSPMTGSGNHTYLLVSPRGSATLVDAGVGDPEHLRDVDDALRRAGATLTSVLVTHGHADHASGAAALAAAQPQAPFAKHPWPEEDSRYAVPWLPLPFDTPLENAAGLVAIHTPGHSPDHVVFWEAESGTAFTGDLVIAGSSVMIHTSRGGNLRQYLAALERTLALAPRRLLPAHGPVVDDPAAVLTGYLQHRRLRETQVLDALARGRDTVEAIADFIYDGLDARLVPAARENVRAHLGKLEEERRAAVENGRWRLS